MNSPTGSPRYQKREFLALSHYHEDQKAVDLHKFEMDLDRHADADDTTNQEPKPALKLADFSPSRHASKTKTANNTTLRLSQIREFVSLTNKLMS